ncbi:hypothetical protein [Amycolatopsis pigmentata]|uniref:Uncharacterized protein n=1 Tax=Amycolatopsis pigmentata TaxID=450801 RepID=A0ABW5FKW2_9PSEU
MPYHRPPTSPTNPIDSPSRQQSKSKQDTARERRRSNKDYLSREPSQASADLIAFVFDENGFYVRLANRLLDKVPWYRRVGKRGHSLCVSIDKTAKGLDPGTYAKYAHKSVRAGLIMIGFPIFVAETLGATVAFGAKGALSALPVTHLTKVLRVLIPLVCPELSVCPARLDVLKTYASPGLADQLKSLATGR